MVKNIFKKSLVIGLMILFTGASVGATIAPNINEKKDIINNVNTSSIEFSQIKGEWSDNFDSYASGSQLHGQGGWYAWDNNSATTAYVTDDQSRSSPNSVEIKWNSGVSEDIVHTFSNVNSGKWRIVAWQYVPSGMQGGTDFILMNTYVEGSGHTNLYEWSLQLEFRASTGLVTDLDNTAKTLPLITDEWVQIRVEIDFDADWQVIYYDNDELNAKSWTAGTSPGGAKNLACVDLYAGTATSTPVYYDDMLLEEALPLSCDADGPYEGIIDQEIQFDGTVAGGLQPYEYLWDFGDGNTATTLDPVYTYSEPGTYTVKLTVTDFSQNVVSDETTATIIGLPVIEIGTIKGGLFKVTATIKNIGDADATGVAWSIELNGGLIILGKTTSGTIDIPKNSQKTVQSDMILGIGKTLITISASIPESSDTKSKSAFVLGFYII